MTATDPSRALDDTERALLLAPCACGHTINHHGSLVACWVCDEDNRECEGTFEDLLCERVGVIVVQRAQDAHNRPLSASKAVSGPECHRDADGPQRSPVSSDRPYAAGAKTAGQLRPVPRAFGEPKGGNQ